MNGKIKNVQDEIDVVTMLSWCSFLENKLWKFGVKSFLSSLTYDVTMLECSQTTNINLLDYLLQFRYIFNDSFMFKPSIFRTFSENDKESDRDAVEKVRQSDSESKLLSGLSNIYQKCKVSDSIWNSYTLYIIQCILYSEQKVQLCFRFNSANLVTEVTHFRTRSQISLHRAAWC